MLSEPQLPSGSSENGSLNAMLKLASGDPMEAGGATSRRRITAGSFKLLTDRLKRKPVSPDETEPVASEARAPEPLSFDMPADIPEIASEPVALAAEPEITALPEFALPAFAPLDPQEPEADVAPEPEPVILAEPEAQHLAGMEPDAALAEPALAVEETSAEVQAAEVAPEPEPVILAEPEAQPLAAMEPDATLAEPALAVEETYAEVPETAVLPEFEPIEVPALVQAQSLPEPVQPDERPAPVEPFEALSPEPVEDADILEMSPEPEIAPEPVAAAEVIECPDLETGEAPADPPAPPVLEAEAVPAPVNDAKPVSAQAGKVVDAMLKTISDSVYAKPNAADRAAFLRDMAELMMQEAATISTLPAPRKDPVPQLAPKPVAAKPVLSPAEDQPETIAIPPVREVPLSDAIAARIGPASALLRNGGGAADPFARDASTLALNDPKPAETVGADEETGDLALTLLAMMSSGAGTALPQERALAADTLLRILPRIPVKQLLAVVERVAIMQAPPPLLVAKLIRDQRPEVVAPLLERCMHITDQDLMAAATEGDAPKQRMIARRRAISPLLADHLIALGDPSVVLTLIRNPAAAFSHDAFHVLAELASKHHGLLAPLATRADLPPPVAFELFWFVPQELRRFIFSRFLTDSETLNKILRITLATHGGADGDGDGQLTEPKFADRDVIDGAIGHAAEFRLDEAARILSEAAGVNKDTALRILADREGEPLTVILKALGYPRGKFAEAMERLRTSEAGILRSDRVVDELQSIFDSLSFNKARILLTYWDWFVRQAGPYAPRH